MQPFDFNNKAYPKFEGSINGGNVDGPELDRELDQMLVAAQRRAAFLTDCLQNTERNVYQSVEQNNQQAQHVISDHQLRVQHNPQCVKQKLKRFPNFKQILSRYGGVTMGSAGGSGGGSSNSSSNNSSSNNSGALSTIPNLPSSSSLMDTRQHNKLKQGSKGVHKQNQGEKTVSVASTLPVVAETKEREKQKATEIDQNVLKSTVSYELGAPRKLLQLLWRSGGPQEQRARKNREKPRSRFCMSSDWSYKSDYTSYSDLSSSLEQILNPSSKILETQCSSSLYDHLPAITMPVRASYIDRLADPAVHQLRERLRACAQLQKHVPRVYSDAASTQADDNNNNHQHHAITTLPQEHACVSDVTLPVLHSALFPSIVPALGAQLPVFSKLGLDRRVWSGLFAAARIPEALCQRFLDCRSSADLVELDTELHAFGFSLQTLFLTMHASYVGTVTSSGIMFEAPEPRCQLVAQRPTGVQVCTQISQKVRRQIGTIQQAQARTSTGGFYTQKLQSMLVPTPHCRVDRRGMTDIPTLKLDLFTSSVLAARLKQCAGPSSTMQDMPQDTMISNTAVSHFPNILMDQSNGCLQRCRCMNMPGCAGCTVQGCVYAVHDRAGGNTIHAVHKKNQLDSVQDAKYPAFCQLCTRPILCKDGLFANQRVVDEEVKCTCSTSSTYTLPSFVPKNIENLTVMDIPVTLQPYVLTRHASKSNCDSRIIAELQLLGLFPQDAQEASCYYHSTQPWMRKDDEMSAAIRMTQEEQARVCTLNDARKLALQRAVFHRLERKLVLGSSDLKTTLDAVEPPLSVQQISRGALLLYRRLKKDKIPLHNSMLRPLITFLRLQRVQNTNVLSGFRVQAAATAGVPRRLVSSTNHAYPVKLQVDAQGQALNDSVKMTVPVHGRNVTLAVMPMTESNNPVLGDSFLSNGGGLVTTATLRDLNLPDTVRGYSVVDADFDEESGQAKKKRKIVVGNTTTTSTTSTNPEYCRVPRDWWTLEQPSIGVNLRNDSL